MVESSSSRICKTSSTGSSGLTALRCPSMAPSSSNSPLDYILIIPKANSLRKQRKVTTTKARLTTDDDVVEDIKRKTEQKQKQPPKRKSRKNITSAVSTKSQKKSQLECGLVYGEDNSV